MRFAIGGAAAGTLMLVSQILLHTVVLAEQGAAMVDDWATRGLDASSILEPSVPLTLALYLPFYYRRRTRIMGSEKLQPVNIATIVGYLAMIVFLVVTASEVWWTSSLGTTTAFLLWGFISNAMVFATFMGSFVVVAEEKFQQASPS